VDFSVKTIAMMVKMDVTNVTMRLVFVILACKIITGMLMNKNV